MIRMRVIRKFDDDDNHFIVQSDEPVLIEVLRDDSGNVHCFVYRSEKTDYGSENEPVGVFDGSIENKDWSV